jgi:hypothetical protein
MEGPILIRDRIACSAVKLAQDRVPKLALGLQKGIEKGMPVVVGSPRSAGLMAEQVGVGIKFSTNLGAKTIEPPAQGKPRGGRIGNDHIRSTRLRGFLLGKEFQKYNTKTFGQPEGRPLGWWDRRDILPFEAKGLLSTEPCEPTQQVGDSNPASFTALAGGGRCSVLAFNKVIDPFNVPLQKRCGGLSMLTHAPFHSCSKVRVRQLVGRGTAFNQDRLIVLIGYQKFWMSSK